MKAAPRKTAFFAVAFLAIFPITLNLTKFVPSKCGPTWGNLSLYERGLQRYEKASGPKTVIVGPSYASHLHISGVHNIAFPGASPLEIEYTIRKNLSPRDRIVYLVTVRDFAIRDAKPQIELRSRTVLRITLLRASILNMVCPATPDTGKSRYDLAGHDLETLREAGQLETYSTVNPKYLYRELFLYTEEPFRPQQIERFQKLHHDYPNLIFVLAPTYPLRTVEEDSAVAVQMNTIVARAFATKQLLSNSGLPFIDFSDSVPPDDFNDYCHLNEHGRKLLIAKLLKRL